MNEDNKIPQAPATNTTPPPVHAAPASGMHSGDRGGFGRPRGGRGRGGRGRGGRGGDRGGLRGGFHGGPRGGRENRSEDIGASETRHENTGERRAADIIPPLAPDTIRIIPLGGVEEIGRNMTMVEFGEDIIVIDMGFQFKEESTPGIDYILPNTTYLEERKSKIRAVILTHGHLDHIGGVPYIMDRIGNPPIYTRALTAIMVKKRQEEFPHLPALDIRTVEKDDTLTIGKLSVAFFAVTHTIPDAMGVIIRTPYGSIVHTGDLKVDHEDGVPLPSEEKEFSKFKNEKVLMLMADSTNVENPGFSIPERIVQQNIENIIRDTKGRLIVGTFASLLDRIIKMVEISEKYGKKVVVEGRSMKNNIEIAKQVGILKAKKETFISAEEMDNYPPERIVALATGAQGDEFAALMRMATKQHKYFKVSKRDTILLSSSVVPGNERSVQKLKDNLSRQGARIIHYRTADVHSSGHANREETAWIHRKIAPRFFVPVHGYHYMLTVHRDIAMSVGLPESSVVLPDNGMIIEIREEGQKLVTLKEKAPNSMVLVDGFSVGDVQEVVLRDRQMLAQDGMFVIVASVNAATGKLRKSPDIISRGFVYLRESQELLHQARLLIKKSIEDATAGQNPIDFEDVKASVADDLAKFLFQETAKRPIVIPVLLAA